MIELQLAVVPPADTLSHVDGSKEPQGVILLGELGEHTLDAVEMCARAGGVNVLLPHKVDVRVPAGYAQVSTPQATSNHNCYLLRVMGIQR